MISYRDCKLFGCLINGRDRERQSKRTNRDENFNLEKQMQEFDRHITRAAKASPRCSSREGITNTQLPLRFRFCRRSASRRHLPKQETGRDPSPLEILAIYKLLLEERVLIVAQRQRPIHCASHSRSRLDFPFRQCKDDRRFRSLDILGEVLNLAPPPSHAK